MPDRELKVNGIYRHFKGHEYKVICLEGHEYKVICLAKDAEDENLREMVVYQDTTKEDLYWVRPLDLFLSEVDHDKYPNVKQKYRFELLD